MELGGKILDEPSAAALPCKLGGKVLVELVEELLAVSIKPMTPRPVHWPLTALLAEAVFVLSNKVPSKHDKASEIILCLFASTSK